jgi:hypothetical protein
VVHELSENCLAKVHPSLSAIDAAGRRPDSSESLYMVTIPPGVTSFSISTSGGTGDVDLFLKRGQAALCQVSDSVSQICSKDDSSDVNDIGFFSLRRAKDAPVRG